MTTKELITNKPSQSGNGNYKNKKNGKPNAGNTGVKGNCINMKPDDSITIWTNYKNDNTNNDGFMEYNKLQVGDRKEATTRSEVQFFIKVAGVWDLQEEVRHCLATTLLQEINVTQYRHVQQQSPKQQNTNK